MIQTTLDNIIRKTIICEVKKGKTKIEIANEFGYSYYTVKKYTQDVHTLSRISDEIIQKMRSEYNKGKSKRQVAEELHVSRDTVIKYTKDFTGEPIRNNKRPEEDVARIREYVLKYQSKSKAARRLGLSIGTVRWYTQDILVFSRRISPEKREKIRKEVIEGKSRYQVSNDLNISYLTVIKHTKDLPNHSREEGSRIRGKTFEMLKKLMRDGYIICSPGYYRNYMTLRKYFPMICKVNACQKTIIFLEDKSDIAIRAFLESLDRRITNYHELKRIIKAFKIEMSCDEKRGYVHKKKQEKQYLNKNSKIAQLRENNAMNKRIIKYKELEQVIKTI
jgi:DNA-binding CsgD family transcriptional regulator